MNAEQEDHARAALTGAGIVGEQQDAAVSNLVGMTEGWKPLLPVDGKGETTRA